MKAVLSYQQSSFVILLVAVGLYFFSPLLSLIFGSVGLGVVASGVLTTKPGEEPEHVSDLEESFAEIVSKSPFPTLIFNSEGQAYCTNRVAERMFDVSQGDWFALKQAVPEVKKFNLLACIEQGGIYTCLASIEDQDLMFYLVGSPKAKIGYIYGVDISKEQDSRRALEASQQFLRMVIDADPNLIFVKDLSGKFTLVNEALARVYNVTPNDMIGKRESDFNPFEEEVSQYEFEDRQVLVNEQKKLVSESRLTDANGNIRYYNTVKRSLQVPGSDEMQVLGVSVEVTERKSLKDQLLHAQKMEAIGQLAGGIAHDFNNLLSGVLGYASVLKFNNADDPEVSEIADKIETAGMRAQKLTGQLLGFARGGKHQHIAVNMEDTIEETMALVQRTIENDIHINLEISDRPLHTIGDPVQVQQVVLNLALNARDAMTESKGGTSGGKLDVSLSKVRVDRQHEKVGLQIPEGDYVELIVKDSGCGISESVQSRIFEPFFSTKEEGKGSGMGLAMVYGIVVSHEGAIAVESQPNKGTSFYIYLPWVESVPQSEVKATGNFSPSRLGKILVADDHKITREVTCRMLETLGYKVVTAVDGMEAYEIYQANPSDFDLLIFDLIMPRFNGLQCFIKCKEINPDVKAVLMTGHSDNNAVQQSLNEGVLYFLQKPFRLHELSAAISKCLTVKQAA